MKQTRIPGTERRAMRPRLYSEEQLRQASRAHRKAHALPGARGHHGERAALRLVSLVQKGHTMDTEKVKAQLQEHEAEYQRGKQMLAGLDQQRADVLRGMMRLEGAMTTLRTLLGADAPAVPEAIAAPPPPVVPEGEPPIGSVQ